MNKFLYILCLLSVLGLTSCEKKEEKPSSETPKPVKVTQINKSEDYILRQFPGQVYPIRDAVLSFKVSGVLIDLAVKKGQEIKKGDLIARLDPVDYKYKVHEQQALYDEKKSLYNRLAKLREKEYISKAEYDKQKSAMDMADANLNLAKQNLKDTYLYAPFNGIIADTYPEKHQRVKAFEQIALLYDLEYIDVAIDVPENIVINMNNTSTKDKVVIFEGAPKKEYPVTYRKHILDSDKNTNTYKVYFSLEAPKEITVLKGMTATIKVKLSKKNNHNKEIFLVPITSVFADETNNSYVWVIDPKTNRVKKTKVNLGSIYKNSIRIESGLKDKDKIVTTGVHLLQEGDLVSEWSN